MDSSDSSGKKEEVGGSGTEVALRVVAMKGFLPLSANQAEYRVRPLPVCRFGRQVVLALALLGGLPLLGSSSQVRADYVGTDVLALPMMARLGKETPTEAAFWRESTASLLPAENTDSFRPLPEPLEGSENGLGRYSSPTLLGGPVSRPAGEQPRSRTAPREGGVLFGGLPARPFLEARECSGFLCGTDNSMALPAFPSRLFRPPRATP
jgi:hypothetical protein